MNAPERGRSIFAGYFKWKPMQSSKFSVAGPVLIVPPKFGDERGRFSETYIYRTFRPMIGDVHFVQDNHSCSVKAGSILGLHFQVAPMVQGKLVRASRGAIFDVLCESK
jgi:dTDP-4-dehydrorhamnose 3,5-epimerase